MTENEKEKFKEDFIKENIDISDYLKELPPITETDLSGNLAYQQTEFKPTLFRYIRLMNKETKDKDNYSYVNDNFSQVSYTLQSDKVNDEDKKETIRRLQKTKLNSNSYPFGELVPSNKKKDGTEDKTEKKDENDNLKKKDKKKKVKNLSQRRHYHVQNFSIIVLCLIINAFCCIIYYTNDWPDLVKRLPNQISFSKVVLNDSFVFTGNKLFIQKNSNLDNVDHHIILKNINYGNISIDASHLVSRVRCHQVQSFGNSITLGFINFTKINESTVQMSASSDYDTISFNMDVNNIGLLDLRQATSVFGKTNDNNSPSGAQLLETSQVSNLKKENDKKTLLKRSFNSEANQYLYDVNFKEILYKKLFEIKKNILYISIFDNNTLSLIHVTTQSELLKRPKINSNLENNNLIINRSTIISEDVKAADVIINDKIMINGKKEIKFIYINNTDFHLHIGKFYFNETKCSNVLDFDLPNINLTNIYKDRQEEEIKIKLLIDSKGFPVITIDDNTIINCRHPLCAFDQYP